MDIKLWEGKIPYYTDEFETPNSMTPYLVNTWHKLPAVVVLPGGGYIKRAEHEGEDIAKFYNSRGIHAFVVNYRLHPNMFPCALADAQRAIKVIKANADEYKVDENRIFVIGFSAGGHLASCVATLEDYSKIGDEYDDIAPSVTGAILSYAVTSARVEDGISEGAGKITDRSDEMLEKLTTYTKINENTPPCFIWHTANDEVVPVSHSLKFAMGLSAHNIPFELHIFPDGHHGLGLARFYKDISKWPDLTVEWIRNNF